VTSRRSRRTSSLAQLVHAGTVQMSRRDLLRASAVVGAASVMGLQSVNAAPAPSWRQQPASQDAPTTDVELHLPFNPYGQAVTVDPHRTVNWGPFWVMLPYAWSGLLRFDENGAVEADLAESVTPNEDGSVWTAVLKQGITFGNGDPVLAEHFVESWRRALDPTQLSPMARFMSPVQGFETFISGESQDIGFRAVDERTIEITLAEPLSHFPSYLATFVWAVMHPGYLQPAAGGEVPLADASAGPWRIEAVDETSRIEMVPNSGYWAPPSPSITLLVWDIAPGAGTDQAILDQYIANQIAVADVPSSLVATVNADEQLSSQLVTIEDHASTLAISMDFHQAPFNDVRVRRAIAHAIDKDAWLAQSQSPAFEPADSFTPTVLSTIAGYQPPAGLPTDPDRAVSLLDEAGVDPETMEQEIIYFQPATDSPDQIERAASLLAMITEVTGIPITHDVNLTREQITALRQDNGGLQFDLVQWWLDSDTPSLLAFASQESEFNAGWMNWEPTLEPSGDFTPGDDADAYNTLISEALATLNQEERNQKYVEAETLLLENAVVVPLGYWIQRYLQKPWLQGTRQGPWSGSTPVRIDENVIVVGDPAAG
jgi:oligopeptide transport system substrate-binding protein